MNKEEYKRFKRMEEHASHCQIETDELAIKCLDMQMMLQAQSICDFNLMSLYNISPEVILHFKTIDFLADNLEKFKRKIKAKEMINFDWILTKNEINDFEQFKQLLN